MERRLSSRAAHMMMIFLEEMARRVLERRVVVKQRVWGMR